MDGWMDGWMDLGEKQLARVGNLESGAMPADADADADADDRHRRHEPFGRPAATAASDGLRGLLLKIASRLLFVPVPTGLKCVLLVVLYEVCSSIAKQSLLRTLACAKTSQWKILSFRFALSRLNT
jgi:hypothetical protein